jgi:hypothetical protein
VQFPWISSRLVTTCNSIKQRRRLTQNLFPATEWRFKSSRPHQKNQYFAAKADFAGWTWVENGWKTMFEARSGVTFAPLDRPHAGERQLGSCSTSSCYIGRLSTPMSAKHGAAGVRDRRRRLILR